MNSHKQDISRLDKIEAGQQQLLQRQPDCSRNGIEGQNDSGNDDALHFPAGGMLETGDDKTNAGTDALDLGKLGSERVEHMGSLDYRDLPSLASHTLYPRRATWSHTEQCMDMRSAAGNPESSGAWLRPSEVELSLEEMMELSIGFRRHGPEPTNQIEDEQGSRSPENHSDDEVGPHQCSASERAPCITDIPNRATISPASRPMDCAGRLVSPPNPSGTASNSSTPVAQRIAQPTSNRQVAGSNPAGCANPFPSGNSGFNELCRISSQPDNLAGEISSRKFSPAFFSFTKTLLTAAACLDNQQHSERAVQNGYPATHKWNSCNDRVH